MKKLIPSSGLLWRKGLMILARVAAVFLALAGCVIFIASPPLHLLYEKAAPAGPSSVCIQGAGFPGFWFQLGFLQGNPGLRDHDFYCYSSGCLSLLMAFMNSTLEESFDFAASLQRSWLNGNISRFELVENFVDGLIRDDDSHADFIGRTNILVTTLGEGVTTEKPKTVEELREVLIRTTFM
eukprot:CAMPEP_0116843912 /NCGR_PEP_ID=MMETSP0418-20121206/12369_1 /TAXON_ID=1158023 /ORGANISM="Astrosyne radiata, Strain 13vi08-1A" /LENGTH=181 /DNA_ID=CAMNT_0004474753 /DNA_START=107 /DNA_END=652 /DNA_ORIENTATION=+